MKTWKEEFDKRFPDIIKGMLDEEFKKYPDLTNEFWEAIKQFISDLRKKDEEGLNPLKKQIAGKHYKDFVIQPIEFIHKNNLGFIEGCIIKYICRYKNKGGEEDIKKIIHYCELLLTIK